MESAKPSQVADVVFVNNSKVLLVQQRKASAHGLWSFPGGRLEQGETPMQAAAREVREEIGVELVNARLLKVLSITTPRGPLGIRVYTGEYSGTIQLNSSELMAYKWFSIDELEDMKLSLRGSDYIIEQAKGVLSQVKL